MLFLLFFVNAHVIPHLKDDANLYSVENPGLLIYNETQPDSPLTIFDSDRIDFSVLPVGLHPLSLPTFQYQVWHTYSERINQGTWLELDGNPTIRVTISGKSIQGLRKRPSSLSMMHFVRIPDTEKFKIISSGFCLTAKNVKSIERDAYPLKLSICDASNAQNFYLESKMKALCKLMSPLCPEDARDVETAEDILSERLKRISMGVLKDKIDII